MAEERLLWLSGKLLSIMLWLYPGAHRREYDTLILQTFRDSAKEQYGGRGLSGLAILLITTLGDVLASAAEEHAELLFHSHRPLLRLSGAAWMLGGALWTLLHTPIGFQWFGMPVLALSLLLGGLIALHLQHERHSGWAGRFGFALSAAGALIVQGGYVAAGLGLWQQSGITPLTGFLLMSAGMLLVGDGVVRTRTITRGRALFFAISLITGMSGLPALVLLRAESSLEAPIALLMMVGGGFLMGIVWAMLGAAMWRAAQMPSPVGEVN